MSDLENNNSSNSDVSGVEERRDIGKEELKTFFVTSTIVSIWGRRQSKKKYQFNNDGWIGRKKGKY